MRALSEFQKMVASDIDDVFLDLDVFAEMHDLNGVKCRAVVQSPTVQERFSQGTDYDAYAGVYGELITVHCKKSDLPNVPEEGTVFKLDKKICKVDSVVDDMGMLTITLNSNRRVIGRG